MKVGSIPCHRFEQKYQKVVDIVLQHLVIFASGDGDQELRE